MIGFMGVTPEQQMYLDVVGNPKPRTTVEGQWPPTGLFPPFKGTPGPRQKTCIGAGGVWTGIPRKRFCVMPGDLTEPMDIGGVDTPPGTMAPEYPGGEIIETPGPAPDYFQPPGLPDLALEDGAVQDKLVGDLLARPGVPGRLPGPAAAMPWGTLVLLGVAGAGVWWFVKKRRRSA